MLLTSHKNHKLSQTGIELLMFFSIAMLIFLSVYTLVSEKTMQAYGSKANSEAIELSERIASEINTAVSEGDGYSKNITLPDNIFGSGYAVEVDGGSVFVKLYKKNAVSRIITKNVTGTFVLGNNRISNLGGVILVN